jgi:hypothetical protein
VHGGNLVTRPSETPHEKKSVLRRCDGDPDHTDIPRNYELTLRDANGLEVNTGMTSVPARSNLPRFVNEILIPPPAPGETFILEVSSEDLSDFSMIGLQFTESVFSTIPVK